MFGLVPVFRGWRSWDDERISWTQVSSQWVVQLGQLSHVGKGTEGAAHSSPTQGACFKASRLSVRLGCHMHGHVLHILGWGRTWLRFHCTSILHRNGAVSVAVMWALWLCLSLWCEHFGHKLTLRKENSKCYYYISVTLLLISFLFLVTGFLTCTNLTSQLFLWGFVFTFLA